MSFHENREAVYCLSHVRGSRRKKDPHMGRQDKSYPPQYTDDTLKVFGIESFADLYAVVVGQQQGKAADGPVEVEPAKILEP